MATLDSHGRDLYSRAVFRGEPTATAAPSKWKPLVRGIAAVALGAAVAAPLVRKRLKLPTAVTGAALAAGPPALAVLAPRTRTRDAALYTLQMWGFLMAHELPYDRPERLERRLRIRYPVKADRFLGGGTLPNTRLQRALEGLGRRNALDR